MLFQSYFRISDEGQPCVCKEEVEREEALALAKAMEVSAVDPPKPIVPGLTPTDREEVITIKIQPDVSIDYRSSLKIVGSFSRLPVETSIIPLNYM